MLILVTGSNGQLGSALVKELKLLNYDFIGTDISSCSKHKINYINLDITERAEVLSAISFLEPDVIIHCAAWTAVDAAENNKDIVYNINVNGTANLVEAANRNNCKFVYISTDYIFDGQGTEPWKEDDTNYNPINYYGETKLKGELVVKERLEKYFIIRTSWVYGSNGSNFVKTMIKAGMTHDTVNVVNDQIGSPTYTEDLAKLIIDMINTNKYGIYHATNSGDYISWYDFTLEIYRQIRLSTKVLPISSNEYNSLAKRPLNSRLSKDKLLTNGFVLLPTWKDALTRYLKDYIDSII